MRKLAGQIVVALVLLALGFAAWTAGRLEERVADAHEELALLHYQALDAEYGAIETSMGLARRIPWVGDALISDVREHRAAADYWQAHYEALQRQPNAAGSTAEQEPGVMVVAANADFRSGQREGTNNRPEMLKRLDTALKTYTEVLKKNPGSVDAAYNYEFIVRLRETVSKSKPAPAGQKREDPAKVVQKLTGIVMAGDLPEGRTVHGDPGNPPPGADMTQFKMHIPIRPDERQGGSDAGQGKEKIRKG